MSSPTVCRLLLNYLRSCYHPACVQEVCSSFISLLEKKMDPDKNPVRSRDPAAKGDKMNLPQSDGSARQLNTLSKKSVIPKKLTAKE